MKYSSNALHAHSDYYPSGYDGVQTIYDYVNIAIEKGATAIALTDHGNCANLIDFYLYCIGKEAAHRKLPDGQHIKPILGVETYIKTPKGFFSDIVPDSDHYEPKETDENVTISFDSLKDKRIRQHLILLCKDYKGFQAMSRYITECNKNVDEKGYPVGTEEMLMKHFGPGTEGHGHIICSTACIGGVLAIPLSYNDKLEKEIKKIERRIETSRSKLPDELTAAIQQRQVYDEQIAAVTDQIEDLKPKATKTFAATKRMIKKEKDEKVRETLQQAMDLEIYETEKAKADTAALKERKKQLQDARRPYNQIYQKHKDKLSKIDENLERINILRSHMKSEEELLSITKQTAKRYLDIFGQEDFYGEIQNHGIPEEAVYFNQIIRVCDELGIELLATNDNHMARKEDVKLLEWVRNMNRLGKGVYQNAEATDAELYYKTGDELAEALRKVFPEQAVNRAMANIDVVCEKCNFELPRTKKLKPKKIERTEGMTDEEYDNLVAEEKARVDAINAEIPKNLHYPEFVDADRHLRELALTGVTKGVTTLDGSATLDIEFKRGGIQGRYGDEWNDELQKRFDYEMSVISEMGFSSYFLFIADVICACKNLDKYMNIGPGRGSGAGSIVCYMSGITELDPIKYNLLFERFLNPERESMPDIDTDFGKIAREFAIDHVTKLYGADRVAGIMTKTTMGPLQAVINATKLYAFKQGLHPKIYEGIGAQLKSYARVADSLSDIRTVIEADFANDKDALNIFHMAEQMEGLMTGNSQHAAGIIAIMDHQIADFIPLIAPTDKEDPSQKPAIQADMLTAESDLGFIKFDFLGLRNINVIRDCCIRIEKKYGIHLDMYSLKYDDPAVIRMFAEGFTNFVFQYESDGMKGMLKNLKPSTFEDLILAVAVYRPGPMDFIPDIIDAKFRGTPSTFVQMAPALESILKETYGYPVYQEQVMAITREIGGFSMGKADNVRRAMSKKQDKDLAKMFPDFVAGAIERGYTEEVATKIWEQLTPFAKYGFNKSHAAAYSVVSYMTAYLKYYYPEEYLCSAITEFRDKLPQLLSDCKALNIGILPPDLNKSEANFSVCDVSDEMDKKEIRFGISCITGLKSAGDVIEKEKEENGPFETLNDFLNRVSLKSNEYNALCLSGALDSFSGNREELCDYIEEYTNANDIVMKCREKLDELASIPVNTEKDANAQQSKIKEWTTKYNNAQAALENVVFTESYPTPNADKVMYEIKYLGTWVSLSPLDDYEISDEYTISHVKEVFEERDPEKAKRDSDKITGIVAGFKEITTKKGDKMGVFDLIDKYGETVPCVVFPTNYDSDKNSCKQVLENNQVITITGLMKINSRNDEVQMEVSRCKRTKNFPKELLLTGPYDVICEALERIRPYQTNTNGINISYEFPDYFEEDMRDFGNYTEDAMDKLLEFADESSEFGIVDGR